MKKSKALLLSTLLLAGCFYSEPEQLYLTFGDASAKSLLNSASTNQFTVYYLNNNQLKQVSNIYMDKLLVEKSLPTLYQGDISRFIDSINSPRLRNYYLEKLPTLLEGLDTTGAIAQYQENLAGLRDNRIIKEAELEEANTRLIKSLAYKGRSIDALDSLEDEIANAKVRLQELEVLLKRTLSNANNSHPNLKISYNDLAFERLVARKTDRSNCNHFSKYAVKTKKGEYCFLKTVPPRFEAIPSIYSAYESMFREYVDLRYKLTRNVPPFEGTFEHRKSQILRQHHNDKMLSEKTYGLESEVNEAITKAESAYRKAKYLEEDYERSRNLKVLEFMGETYDRIRETILYGIKLAEPNSPLGKDARDVMNGIYASTLNADYTSEFISNSTIALVQVNDLHRDDFPVFLRPKVFDQELLLNSEQIYMEFNSDTIEFVGDEGVADTIVMLIGEAFISWRNGNN